MGKFLKASCKCGYTKSSLNFGHGMYNNENFGVPCLVLDSFEVCSSDITKINENIDVLFYNNSLLQDKKQRSSTIFFRDITLQNNGNFCPKCCNYDLSFSLGLIYD